MLDGESRAEAATGGGGEGTSQGSGGWGQNTCFRPGPGVLWGAADACLPAQPPSCSLSLQGEQRVAAAARARASPDLRPCLTLVPAKPCDATRPQERGFNKRYRFLELRLGGFPEEDRLCATVPAAPFLLRCPHSRPPSLSQSDYLETPPCPPSPLGPRAPLAGPSAQRHPWEPQAQPIQSIPSTAPEMLGLGWTSLGPPGVQKPTPPPCPCPPDSSSWQSGWAQIRLGVTGSKWTQTSPSHFICPPDRGHSAGRHPILVYCLAGLGLGDPEEGGIIPFWQGRGGRSETQGSWMRLSLGGGDDSGVSHFLSSQKPPAVNIDPAAKGRGGGCPGSQNDKVSEEEPRTESESSEQAPRVGADLT